MLDCQRAAFSLPRELHYLNCSYMSPLSKRVVAAGVEGIQRKTVPSRIVPSDFFDGVNRVRALFARLINVAHPENVAMVPSVSYGMAIVARNVPLRRDQNVVTVHNQFPANMYPWRRLCTDTGAELRVVAPPDTMEDRAAGWTAKILDAIDAQTALVTVPTVHWTDGTVFDLMAIGGRARDVDAAFALDGTQSVGAMPFDVAAIAPDALVCAAYKWLMGPYATGCAYFGPRFLEGIPLEETWIGRRGSDDFSALVNYQDEYREGAIRFDVGENSNFALMPMLEASLTQVLEWGVERIYSYCDALTAHLLEVVRDRGYLVADGDGRARHMFGIRVPTGLDVAQLKDRLEQRQVFVSIRGDALRISPHVYNDRADVDALAELL